MKPSLPDGYNDAAKLHKLLIEESEQSWLELGQQRTLRLFHEMSERVPAYQDFLKKQNFDPSSVRSIEDFRTIPTINKDNYLRKYPRELLVWEGKFATESWVISTTSGSTGEPYYFPRTDLQDQALTITTELYLRNNFSIQEKTTLYIDAFPMGAWIGGLYTYESIKQIAEKGYPISIITPGIHKQEVIKAVQHLGRDFDQIIIGAYAPFLKDILDDGKRAGVNWTDYDIGFVFSAEAFTETFRNYVLKTVGAKDEFTSTLNHYGTVDLGTMAHETPLSIEVRRKLVKEDRLKVLFPEKDRQPTFAQYDPRLFYFESEDGNLICSSYSGIPLIRYDLKDYGGVLSKQNVLSRMQQSGMTTEASQAWNLPFVYVYERNDFSVSYYAFLIYPDTIRRALQNKEFNQSLTGKFTMLVDYNETGRQILHIHVEKKHSVEDSPELTELIENHVHEGLLNESSEYRETFKEVGEIARPVIHLWDYESTQYFKAGTKQKWVEK